MNEGRSWFSEAVFYELYVRAYRDSNGDGHGDFRGTIEKLDHIASLGVDCIWIQPHYPSPLLDDGYDVADYYGIHPDYGDLEDFKAFLDAAHDRGLKVVADLVMNHTSAHHPWFQMARKDPTSPFRNYYVWSDTGQEYGGARIIFLDYESSNWSYDEVAGQYYWHRFYSTQPDLNFDNSAVHEEMMRIIRFWMDMGLDGFRADAVPYLYEREGTNCENLPETHLFLKKVRRIMDEEYPDRVLIAEANQWPWDLLPYFGDGDEFHICFHFPIMPRLFMAMRQGIKEPILKILAQTPDIPPGAQWMTFLRNHDELTLEMVTPDEREWMWQQYAPDPAMRSNLGIRRRLTPLLDNHRGKWLILNAILVSLMGTPIIYYGDEIGMGDNIALPDRHGLRTPMQWDSSPNAGFTSAAYPYNPVLSDPLYGYQQVNVAAQDCDPGSYLNALRFLLAVRRERPELRRGRLEILDNEDQAVFGYWRITDSSRTLCLYNLGAEANSISLDLTGVKGGRLVDLLQEGQVYPIDDYPVVIRLRPYASHWLTFEASSDAHRMR